ncbi:MAG: HEAT repeat domain-containing protein [Planctomycetota bacterium]|nr:HEAT repeat domain-containing protein [Planctomycetota bacterium]
MAGIARRLGLFILLAGLCVSSRAEEPVKPDRVELKSGEEVVGKIVNETDLAVFIQVDGGEQRGIAKTRIKRIQRGAQAVAQAQAPEPAPGPAQVPAAEPDAPVFPPAAEARKKETEALFEQLKDLGAPQREKRSAALKQAVELGFRAVPVLLAVFDPDNKQPPEMRMGALRALAELGPLDQQGALVVGWAAMQDPDLEVRREAARTIRALKEDRAIGWILQFALREDARQRVPAAAALREIDNDLAFAELARHVPQPTVNAANPGTGPSEVRRMDLPIGPLGSKMPIFLPTQEVSGTADNIASPASDALKQIAGKDLGNLPGVWMNWLNEKVGLWSKEEREKAYKDRSLINKIGSPHVQGQ